MNRRLIVIGISGIALAGAVAGSYFVVAKFLQDRQNAAAFDDRDPRRRLDPLDRRPGAGPNREVRTYTAEELEKARREGKLPKGVPAPPPVANPAANDAAIQRTLRTLEEINRINQMNQRLLEQQQRQNR